MPPKTKVTKEAVLAAAVELVRRDGAGALNARALAGELGCSTQPLFTHYPTMEALKTAVIEEATARWLGCIETEHAKEKWLPYKAMGVAYWRFAVTERELFKLLFMRDRTGEEFTTDESFTMAIAAIQKANGMTYEVAERFHMAMWAAVHGLATMSATGYLSLNEEQVSGLMSEIYQGLHRVLASISTEDEQKSAFSKQSSGLIRRKQYETRD